MTHALSARLRRLWLNVHLWLGVGLLIAIIPLSVSGSALVWKDGLDRVLHPQRFAVSGETVLPAADYARTAAAAFGDRAVLTQVRLPREAGDPVMAMGRIKGPPGAGGRPRTLTAWIDPPTAKVLDTGEPGAEAIQFLHRLHGSLLIPEVGRKVVGWLGWAMFISSATGLWLWWPRHGSFLSGLRWRRGPSKLFNLHHMVGFWICIPLAVLSLTGVYISFPQTSRALFGIAPPPAPAGGGGGRFAPPLAEPALSLEQAVGLAQAAYPQAKVLGVTFPARGKEPAWRIELKGAGKKTETVQVGDATAQVKRGGGQGPGGPDPLSRWMRQVHDGNDTGLVWQTFVFLGGIAPAVLAITGLVMWLRRETRLRRLKQAQP